MSLPTNQLAFADAVQRLTPLLQGAYEEMVTQSHIVQTDDVFENLGSWLDPWLAEQGERRSPDPWTMWRDWIEIKLKPSLRRLGSDGEKALFALQNNTDPVTESQVIALAIAISIALKIEQPTPSNLLLITLAIIRRKTK